MLFHVFDTLYCAWKMKNMFLTRQCQVVTLQTYIKNTSKQINNACKTYIRIYVHDTYIHIHKYVFTSMCLHIFYANLKFLLTCIHTIIFIARN